MFFEVQIIYRNMLYMFQSSVLRILIYNHLLVRTYNSLYKICNEVNKQG